jgi:hypothetical protein
MWSRGRAGRCVSVFGVVALLALVRLASSPPVAAVSITAYVGMIDDDPTPVSDCLTPTNSDCTLRDAIAAVAGGSPATVQFGANFPAGAQTISLGSFATQEPLLLANTVTIIGPTGQTVAVDGTNTVTIFTINPGVTAAISNLTIQNGHADGAGGGISNSGTLSVTNCTLSANSAANFAGGIYNGSNATLTVTNSTFSGNSAANFSGGIFNEYNGTVTLTNTLVASSNGGDLYGAFGGNNNLIDDHSGALTGTGNIVGTPALLGSLGSYGGPTRTFPLLPGSPAIDAGAAVGGTVPAADQRGKPRVGMPDIGAFESQGFTFTKTSGDEQSTLITTPFAPLVVTVASTHGEPVDGGLVTFTGPSSGAGIATSPVTVTISGRQASITPTANSTPGSLYHVTAAASGASPSSVTFLLTNFAALTGISPPSGSITGGGTVTLTGDFGDPKTTSVFLDGTLLAAADITVSATQITYRAPAHTAGSITVTAAVGKAAARGSATYQYGVVAPLPQPQPPGTVTATPSPGALPAARPTDSPDPTAPNPLPATRP